jgi:hypothetical protein
MLGHGISRFLVLDPEHLFQTYQCPSRSNARPRNMSKSKAKNLLTDQVVHTLLFLTIHFDDI